MCVSVCVLVGVCVCRAMGSRSRVEGRGRESRDGVESRGRGSRDGECVSELESEYERVRARELI